MSDKEHITDKDLDRFLQGADELSTIYSASKDLQTPEHLEFAVKRMAREAENRATTGNRWIVPLSIAATIIMAISLTFYKNDSETGETTVIAESGHSKPEETVSPEAEPVITSGSTNIKKDPVPVIKTPGSKTSPQVHQQQIAQKPEDTELPTELKALMQSTHGTGNNELLPPEILKTWTQAQWHEQVKALYDSGNIDLARKYQEEYTKYFPGMKLELPGQDTSVNHAN